MKTTCLITGATGFLGKELTRILSSGTGVDTLGRSAQNRMVCDLTTEPPRLKTNYNIVVHNAGKAHVVPKTTADAESFFRVNYHGTLNLLEGIQQSGYLPEAFVFISTVAVYGVKKGSLLDEDTPLNASDPYGLSKKMAEEAVQKWGETNGVRIGILRLPLVAGANPPGNLSKMLNALKAGYFFHIGKGDARRSMVSATDVARIIPALAKVGGTFNLTDQYHPSFSELSDLFSKKLEVRTARHIPLWLAKTMAKSGDMFVRIFRKEAPFSTRALSKMTSSLTFSDEKAKRLLNWQPQRVLELFEGLSKTDLLYD